MLSSFSFALLSVFHVFFYWLFSYTLLSWDFVCVVLTSFFRWMRKNNSIFLHALILSFRAHLLIQSNSSTSWPHLRLLPNAPFPPLSIQCAPCLFLFCTFTFAVILHCSPQCPFLQSCISFDWVHQFFCFCITQNRSILSLSFFVFSSLFASFARFLSFLFINIITFLPLPLISNEHHRKRSARTLVLFVRIHSTPSLSIHKLTKSACSQPKAVDL